MRNERYLLTNGAILANRSVVIVVVTLPILEDLPTTPQGRKE